MQSSGKNCWNKLLWVSQGGILTMTAIDLSSAHSTLPLLINIFPGCSLLLLVLFDTLSNLLCDLDMKPVGPSSWYSWPRSETLQETNKFTKLETPKLDWDAQYFIGPYIRIMRYFTSFWGLQFLTHVIMQADLSCIPGSQAYFQKPQLASNWHGHSCPCDSVHQVHTQKEIDAVFEYLWFIIMICDRNWCVPDTLGCSQSGHQPWPEEGDNFLKPN